MGAGPSLVLIGGAFNDRHAKAAGTPLARLLAPHFTVTSYDRRGRGDSGSTPIAAGEVLDRELEDLAAVVAAVGGHASLFGMSSGGLLALAAARRGLPVDKRAAAGGGVTVDERAAAGGGMTVAAGSGVTPDDRAAAGGGLPVDKRAADGGGLPVDERPTAGGGVTEPAGGGVTVAAGSVVTLDKIATYEAPVVRDDAARPSLALAAELRALVASGDRGEAAARFLAQVVGVPAPVVANMRRAPMWPGLEALAHTLAYDVEISAQALAIVDEARRVTIPTIILAGTNGPPILAEGTRLLADVLPNGQLRMLEGQTHDVDPAVLAAALLDGLG